jgi:thioredoxin-like negative regulator of GroEL
MPNVYENYVKYHPQGFEVLAVSLDKDLMDLKRFLVEKNPPWVVLADEHPSNPQSMASKFGIRAIPTMLLIGKDGQVLDADCRGARLSAKLAEIFGG